MVCEVVNGLFFKQKKNTCAEMCDFISKINCKLNENRISSDISNGNYSNNQNVVYIHHRIQAIIQGH